MNTSNKTNKAANDLLRSELYLGFIQQKSKVLGFDNLVSILVDTRSYLLKYGCAVQQVMMPMQSRDADEPRQHTTSGTESCPEPLIVGCPCGKGHVDDRPVEL